MSTIRTVPKWIATYSGKHFIPTDPSPLQIDINDIAQSLSQLCRYTGQCKDYWCVGQHSILVSYILKAQGYSALMQYAGLLHDAAEAYIGDINSPTKYGPGLEGFNFLEAGIIDAIEQKFDIPIGILDSPRVKLADQYALTLEAPRLFNDVSDWNLLEVPKDLLAKMGKFPYNIALNMYGAKQQFLEEFNRLKMEVEKI